jgi:hypothetical protein
VLPIRSGDGSQHSDEAIRRSVRRAFETDDGPIAAAIAKLEPTWVTDWRSRQGRLAEEQENEDEAQPADNRRRGARAVPRRARGRDR